MDRVYVTNEGLGYIATAVQRTNELLIEVLAELKTHTITGKEIMARNDVANAKADAIYDAARSERWYGAWADKNWMADERQEIRACSVPAIMQANLVQWGLAGLFEVREIGDDGLPVEGDGQEL